MTTTTDQKWIDDMVVELRLRDVRGAVIGDAVASVESHCADSRQSAQEAFGDPREYARSLEFSPSQLEPTGPGEWVRVFAPVVVGLLGFSLFLQVVGSILRGEPLSITWGAVASMIVLILAVVLTLRSLPALLHSRSAAALFFGSVVVVMGLLPVLWSTPLFSLTPAAALVVALPLLAASVVLARLQRGRVEDPVTDPVEHQDRYGSTHSTRSARAATIAREWTFVIASVLVGALLWGLHVLVA